MPPLAMLVAAADPLSNVHAENLKAFALGLGALVIVLVAVVAVLAYLLVVTRRTLVAKEEELRDKEEELRDKDTKLKKRPEILVKPYHIATIGYTSCGKTALTLKWTNPLIDISLVPPTVNPREYEKLVSTQDVGDGNFFFHTYVIHDYPGEEKSAVRDAMQALDIKALLLVVDVAKTETDPNDSTKQVSKFSKAHVENQVKKWNFDALEFLFSQEIQKKCNKYILFINKIDTLQKEFRESDEETDKRAQELYKDVIESLQFLGKKFGATIRVVTGSAQTGRGCPELYKELLTDILPEAARDKSLQYIPDAKDAKASLGPRDSNMIPINL
jgi:hypothetical protein